MHSLSVMMNNNGIKKKVEQSHSGAISIHCLNSHHVKFVQQPSYLKLGSVWLGREEQILWFSHDLFIVKLLMVNFSSFFEYGELLQQFFFQFSFIWESLEIRQSKCKTFSLMITYFRSLYCGEQVKYAVIFRYNRERSYCIFLMSVFLLIVQQKMKKHSSRLAKCMLIFFSL